MGRVVILPDTLCNQIAAGEVVERPAAVVKELVENSIDAGSLRISVALLQGGRKEIRVLDNGTGMSSEDALLALERHATSKIRTIDDLHSIRSLGFRGEALPSIAAVSRFELITRESSAVSGTHIRMEGGIVREVREAGCPPGTLITVRDLFYNVPARRKFLRSIDTEISHISDQFLRLALAHPGVHFQLSHQERVQYDFPRCSEHLSRVAQILGADLASKFRPFSRELPTIAVNGLAGPPELQRTNSQSMFSYVNGRPVWDRTINHAILSAYETMLPKGRFPVAVLFLEMPPEMVDVNVHPTKREVRFRNPGEVIQAVRDAIRVVLESGSPRNALYGTAGHSARAEVSSPSRAEFSREGQLSLVDQHPGVHFRGASPRPVEPSGFPAFSDPPGQPPSSAEEMFRAAPSDGPAPGDTPRFSSLPILGQLAMSYILLEAPDGLIVIDQHAAHERILFDAISSASAKEPAQRLAHSMVLTLLPREAIMLQRWLGQLVQIGFEIESFGGDSFVVHAVPAALEGYAPEVIIRELLHSACEEENSPRWDLLAGLAKTAACHSAIRAGQKLRLQEMQSLLEALDRTTVSFTCPHGRPLWFKLTCAEIAKLFHRT